MRIVSFAMVILAVSLLPCTFARGQNAEIQRASATPFIDGMIDGAWGNATVHGTDEFLVAGGGSSDGPQDLDISWRALWDDDNLYVLIEVVDDVIINDDSRDWQDDSIELYIDAQDTNAEDYRPNNEDVPAYQLTAIAGFDPVAAAELRNADETTSALTHGTNSYAGADDATRFPQGSDTSTTTIAEDGSGWTFEGAFPWTSLEDTPNEIIARGGFGFGLAYNDDDDRGGRDVQLMWATSNGNLWRDASVFPTASLVGPVDPIGMPGDINDDGVVDLADYDILRANFNTRVQSREQGDLDFNRLVDLHDFLLFQAAFNEANGAAAVPEPGNLFLLSMGGLLLLLRTSRRSASRN